MINNFEPIRTNQFQIQTSREKSIKNTISSYNHIQSYSKKLTYKNKMKSLPILSYSNLKNDKNKNILKSYLEKPEIITQKNDEILKKNTNESISPRKNNNRKSSLVKIPKTNNKVKNPFEIEDEDKIFTELIKNKKKSKKKTNKNKFIPSLKLCNTALSKVYKKLPLVMYRLENIKKLKSLTDLNNYQEMLFNTGSKCLPKDSRIKISDKFKRIRDFSEKNYILFENSLEHIENEEKKIIQDINTKTNFFKKIMRRNNKAGLIYNKTSNFDLLPDIKFYCTSRGKLINKKFAIK